MSTAHDDRLHLRPFAEIDASAPDCGVTALPGRLAALTHPLNKGREILLPDREQYDPDVCTVVSSGVTGFEPGEVVVLAPDHGAFYPSLSPDGRELRMVGVVKQWWESVLGKLSADGFAPAPGWMLVERELAHSVPSPLREKVRMRVNDASLSPHRPPDHNACHPHLDPLPQGRGGAGVAILLPDTVEKFAEAGTVLASCGEGWSSPHGGERVCTSGLRTYTFREVLPDSWALVKAPIVSKKWLSSL